MPRHRSGLVLSGFGLFKRRWLNALDRGTHFTVFMVSLGCIFVSTGVDFCFFVENSQGW